MALDPRIPMTGQVPDLLTAVKSGLGLASDIRSMPLREEILRQQALQGQQNLQQQQFAQQQQELLAPLRQKLLEAQVAAAQRPPVDESLQDIRKEVRGSVGKEVIRLGKEASTIESNFNKLKNLTGDIQKGNRNAVAQALVSLVKLGDPGSVVKDSEMIAALNEASPIAAVAGLLSGKGVKDDVVRSVSAKIDPLNPSNINIDDLLATAQSLVSANVPAIQESFGAQRERALDNLSEAGFKSIFNQRTEQRIQGLTNIIGSQEPSPELPPELPEGTVVNPDGTFTLPDGTVVRRKG